MLSVKEQSTVPVTIIQQWYDTCDPELLASDFVCDAVGYGTAKSKYRGSDGMLNEFFGEIGELYDDWSLNVDRYIDGGGSITVLGSYSAQPRGGKKSHIPFVHVWDLSEDEKIQSVKAFTDVRLAS